MIQVFMNVWVVHSIVRVPLLDSTFTQLSALLANFSIMSLVFITFFFLALTSIPASNPGF